MSEKGKPDWTRHDFGAFSDMRMIKVRAKFGLQGYGLFWYIVEQLGLASDNTISMQDIEVLAFGCQLQADYVLEFVQFCFAINLLEMDGNSFFSNRLNRELGGFYKLSKKRAIAGSKGGKQKASNGLAIAKQLPSQDRTGQNRTGQNRTEQNIYAAFENQFKQGTNKAKEQTWPLYVECLKALKTNSNATYKDWESAFDRRNPTTDEIAAIVQHLTEYAKIAKAAKEDDFVPALKGPDKYLSGDAWTADLPELKTEKNGLIDWSKVDLK